MRGGSVVVALAVTIASAATSVSAHRRDEYLQAARVSIAPSRIDVEFDLTPGIAVADAMIAEIDLDSDGSLSDAERAHYIAELLSDIDLRVDGEPLRLEAIASDFPDAAALRGGDQAIRLRTAALVRASTGPHHLSLSNAHHPELSAYMANALAPERERIEVGAQHRDPEQRELIVDYTVRAEAAGRPVVWMFGGIAGLLLVMGVYVHRSQS